MLIGRISKDPEGRRVVARALLQYAATRVRGPFMYLNLFGRGAPRGDTCVIYPGLRGDLCCVNPNTGYTVVVVAVDKVQRWANAVLASEPIPDPAGRNIAAAVGGRMQSDAEAYGRYLRISGTPRDDVAKMGFVRTEDVLRGFDRSGASRSPSAASVRQS